MRGFVLTEDFGMSSKGFQKGSKQDYTGLVNRTDNLNNIYNGCSRNKECLRHHNWSFIYFLEYLTIEDLVTIDQ